LKQLQPPSSLPPANYNLDGGKKKINIRELRSTFMTVSKHQPETWQI